MKTHKSNILALLGLFGLGLAAVAAIGLARWHHETSRLADQLLQDLPTNDGRVINFDELHNLPAPVQRYFRACLKDGAPLISSGSIRQAGQFRVRSVDGEWRPFSAQQYFTAMRPGFVWDADINMAVASRMQVRDSYIGGLAAMQAKLFSLVQVAGARDTAELNAGALQRYLAEAVWFPTALLPSAGVAWSAVDRHRALATLVDGGTSATLEFRFNERDEIASVYTPARFRESDGHYQAIPWEGHYSDYREYAGMRVPGGAEVAWLSDGEHEPYFRGEMVDLHYVFVQ
jgi:hypothetical protein